MPLAVKCAYRGSDFAGSQKQPHGRTVEDALERALRRIGAGQRVSLASRTDAGVSALGNVFVLTEEVPLGRLNKEIDSIMCVAASVVPSSFNPRHADSRHYRYVLPDEMLAGDAGAFATALSSFRGDHDFAAFCRERARATEMRIDDVRVDRACGAFLIDFHAQYFLRNQVRFMVGAGLDAARKGDAAWIADSLASGARVRAVEPAPPEGLILMEVAYRGVSFAPAWQPPSTTRKRMLADLQSSASREEFVRSLLAPMGR